MKKQKITQDIIQDFILLYNNGFSTLDISKKYQEICSINTIRRHLKKNGVVLRGNFVTAEQIENVCKLYSGGLSEETVGNIVGLCRATVRKILRKNQIVIRTQKETSKKYDVDEDYFTEINTQNKAYILGFFYADGNVGLNNNVVQIALQARDKHILDEMNKQFGGNRPLVFDERSKKYNNHQDIYMLTLKNNKIHDDLIRYGVKPQKTHSITYPEFLSDDLHRHFLRGVMDGDGCIHGTEKSRKIRAVDICGTQMFCEKAKEVIENSLGIHCSLISTNKACPNTKKLVISGIHQATKFLNWIYEDAEMYLIRKYNIYLEKYLNIA